MRTPTVQPRPSQSRPSSPQLPAELLRRLDECRTGADHVRVLLAWGWEHGFRAADAPAAGKDANAVQYRVRNP